MIRQSLRPFAHFADFRGRASRAEYWGFTLLILVLGLIAVAIELRFAMPRLALLFGPLTLPLALVTLVPGFAVQTRRLHDVGLSGWWALVMWGPYFVSLAYFASHWDSGLSMMFDPQWMSAMMVLSSVQAVGGFALISLLVQRGKRGANAYGDDPYGAGEPATA